jgi:hypothetical protein
MKFVASILSKSYLKLVTSLGTFSFADCVEQHAFRTPSIMFSGFAVFTMGGISDAALGSKKYDVDNVEPSLECPPCEYDKKRGIPAEEA